MGEAALHRIGGRVRTPNDIEPVEATRQVRGIERGRDF